MFKHAFHGGPAVEVFSTSGKNPLEKWKSSGTITKAFDSSVKGYIYTLDGQAKMQLPKDDKEILGLIQPFLVFQIFIPLGKNIHIEIGITDSQKTKRRLIFHSGAKEIVSNPLHARIPVNHFKRNQWVNLALDIYAFSHYCFKGVNIRSIDLIIITASCKLRKIFTMKNPLYDDQEADDPELSFLINELMNEEQRDNLPFEYAPKSMSFPQGFIHSNQMMFPQRIVKHLSGLNGIDENINNINSNKGALEIAGQKKIQLAFGQRIAKIPQSTAKKQSNQLVNKQQPQASDIENDDFYSPLTTDQMPNNQNLKQQKINYDLEQINDYDDNNQENFDDEGIPSSEIKQQRSPPKQRITKEELKEETHYLYLQNNSDEEEEAKIQPPQKKVQFGDKKNKQQSNPWDIQGRKNHDVKNKDLYLHKKQSNQSSKNNSPQRSLKKETSNKKIQNPIIKPQVSIQNSSNDFYSHLDQGSNSNPSNMRLDSETSDDYKIQRQFNKVNELSSIINDIEVKYTGRQNFKDSEENLIKQPEIIKSPVQFKGKKGLNKNADKNKVKLKQDEAAKKLSNYQAFDLQKWDTNENGIEENDNFIEEAFDLNNDNLINFQNNQDPLQPISNILTQKNRISREFKENPLYIEFELNNDDDDQVVQSPINDQKLQDKSVFNRLPTDNLDTNFSYQRLESQRKPDRRPFSPPFKLNTQQEPPANSDFQQKLDFLKVQKAMILRDSLDDFQVPKDKEEIMKNLPPKTTVENEEGEVVDVIYDPVLKCYYDPKNNTYYELKSQ